MLIVVIVIHFLLDFATSIFQPLGPYAVQRYAIDPRTYAMSLYLVSLFSSITQPVFGVISDRVEKRNIYLTLVAALTFIFSSLISIAGSFYLFLVFVFIAQFANSAFHPMGASLSGQKRKENIAFFTLAGMMGYASGPIFITWYAEKYQLKGFYLFGLAMAIFAAATLPMFKNLKVSKRRVEVDIKSIKVLLPIFFFVAFRSFAMGIAQIYGPMYAKSIGLSLVYGGSLLTVTRIVGMPLSTLGVFVGRKIGNAYINLLSGGLMVTFGLIFSRIHFENISGIWMLILFVSMLAPAYFSMSSTVVEAQLRLHKNPGLASSIVMGFGWAMGNLMNFVYSSVFGNDVKFMINSFWIVSLAVVLVAVWDIFTFLRKK